jgi:hypothetical protein
MPTQQIFCHLKPTDRIDGSVQEHVTDDLYAAISLREEGSLAPALSLFLNPGQLVALKLTCDQLVEEMRAKYAGPESATPIGSGGRCAGCGSITPVLYRHRIVVGEDRDEVEACANCAGVPLLDALSNAVRLAPDESPADVRSDLHDAGLDDEAVA